MLTILVGEVCPNTIVDLNTGEVPMMPKAMLGHYLMWRSTFTFTGPVVIRVYTDTIVNFIGAQIEDGEVNADEVEIITEFGFHRFDEKGRVGIIGDDWPWGLFNCT